MGPPGTSFFPTRDELPANEDFISFSLSMEGNRAVIAADIPLLPIKAFVEVTKQKMMQNMMQNMQPGGPGGPVPVVPPDFNEDF